MLERCLERLSRSEAHVLLFKSPNEIVVGHKRGHPCQQVTLDKARELLCHWQREVEYGNEPASVGGTTV